MRRAPEEYGVRTDFTTKGRRCEGLFSQHASMFIFVLETSKYPERLAKTLLSEDILLICTSLRRLV